ncbi:hypothetical protein IEQ34_006690 [Dendrobium chrysotoxum]|uniref:HTH La-type RNA-binding domain-containing protein n=1 Tax=Dendrobium chrysotoxum TaxID=161865 RepID=A0AAV7GR36_DENCH|nr:hypothetical protein IEQ34_006690 [Dendrobium chrysotoxum]
MDMVKDFEEGLKVKFHKRHGVELGEKGRPLAHIVFMGTQGRASSSPPLPLATGDSSASKDPFIADTSGDPHDTETQDHLEDCEPVDEGSRPVTQDDTVPSAAASLHNVLFDKIVRQVEYYFSDENLPKDAFLLKQVRKDKEGYVPITLISSFKKMKKLTKDLSLIEAALRTSSLVVVSSDGKRVKRLHPLPVAEVRDEKRIVLKTASGGSLGQLDRVSIRNPHSAEQLATLKKADFAISSKLHALVEYDTVEAAETAVLTLNDEMNWRNGMRVQILLKRMQKYGLVPKRRKDTFSEKIKGAEALEIPVVLNQNGLEKEEEENANGGHGNAISGSSAEGVSNKPISGPKMPDGTRGFTMGRGRPVTA